jgi:serine protease Do
MQTTQVNMVRGSTVSEILNGTAKFPHPPQIQYENVGPTLQNMVSNVMSSVVTVVSISNSKKIYSTGAVVDSGGDVLVSAGAVQPNAKVVVTTMSNKSFDGSYVGSDTESGLGLVKVKGLNMKPINLASSTDFVENTIVVNICREHVNGKLDVSISKILDVNEKAQISNAETTVGILVADPPTPDMTDGGILVDSSGNLVGIENMLIPSDARTKNYSSTEVAKWVIDDLETSGDVDHGWLGIQGETVPNKGVQIQAFLPNSPCQSVGIQIGDIIVAFNGTNVLSLKQLQLELFATKPSQTIILTVDRGSKVVTFKVPLVAN